jgi:hypothetical protein
MTVPVVSLYEIMFVSTTVSLFIKSYIIYKLHFKRDL